MKGIKIVVLESDDKASNIPYRYRLQSDWHEGCKATKNRICSRSNDPESQRKEQGRRFGSLYLRPSYREGKYDIRLFFGSCLRNSDPGRMCRQQRVFAEIRGGL